MLQMRLKELGYYTGTVTGGYYGGTIKAVEAFQRDHGLTVDGAAGQQTQSLLFSSAVDPSPSPAPTPAETPAPTQSAAPSMTPTLFPTASPTHSPLPSAKPAPTPFAPLPGSVG